MLFYKYTLLGFHFSLVVNYTQSLVWFGFVSITNYGSWSRLQYEYLQKFYSDFG